MGYRAVSMFRFSAETVRPEQGDREKLQHCCLVLFLLAHRYGESPPGETRSYVELEYDDAKRLQIPRLVFLIDPAHHPLYPEGPQRNVDDGADWPSRYQQLEAFKQRIRNDDLQPTPFTDRDLPAKVVQAIRDWESRQDSATAQRTAPTRGAHPHLLHYREHVLQSHAELDLVGFPRSVRVPLLLDELFVPLRAVVNLERELEYASAAEAREDPKLHDRSRETPLALAFRTASQHRKARGLVILGDPGAGKTTQLRRMARTCVLDGHGPAELELPADVLPVFLPLRYLQPDDLDQEYPIALLQRAAAQLDSATGVTPEEAELLLSGEHRLLYLFDGLDEVPAAHREATARWIQRLHARDTRSWFAVTCRYAGYAGPVRFDDDFLELHLRPLGNPEIAEFVRRWYRIVETRAETAPGTGLAEDPATDLIERLQVTATRSIRINEMAANPLLLTVICLVHRDHGRILPEARVELYDDCLATLLDLWRKRTPMQLPWKPQDAQKVLQAVALHMHRAETARMSRADLQPVLAAALRRARISADAGSFLDEIRDRSGLLTGWSGDAFGFLHLGFQEHLATRAILEEFRDAMSADAEREALQDLVSHYGRSWWEEVTLLLVAQGGRKLFRRLFEQVVLSQSFGAARDLNRDCIEEAPEPDPTPFRSALEAGGPAARAEAMSCLRLLGEEPADVSPTEALAGSTSTLSSPGHQPVHQIHQATGIVLAQIPGGRFEMGSDRYGDEAPIHTVDIPGFWLATTPVTNEQYRRFCEDTGHEPPESFKDRAVNGAQQPVTHVSWNDARAFCEWAGLQLPSEAMWEYACRAGTTTEYWSGNETADLARVGWFKENSAGQLQQVGQKSANAFGLHDVHGNVWEWCQDNFHGDYQGAPTDCRAWEEGGSPHRVVRGGSFGVDAGRCRSAFRNGGLPSARRDYLGFRPASFVAE